MPTTRSQAAKLQALLHNKPLVQNPSIVQAPPGDGVSDIEFLSSQASTLITPDDVKFKRGSLDSNKVGDVTDVNLSMVQSASAFPVSSIKDYAAQSKNGAEASATSTNRKSLIIILKISAPTLRRFTLRKGTKRSYTNFVKDAVFTDFANDIVLDETLKDGNFRLSRHKEVHSGQMVETEGPIVTNVHSVTNGEETLSLEGATVGAAPKLTIKLIVKLKKQVWRKQPPEGGWSSKRYPHKLGHSPFDAALPGPSHNQCEVIFNLLQGFHAKDEKPVDFFRELEAMGEELNGAGPMHAGMFMTFNTVFQVLLSQATKNEFALMAFGRARKGYQYVNATGKKVMGKAPNYHDMLCGGWEKLKELIGASGLNEKRPKAAIDIMNIIRDTNLSRMTPEERAKAIEGNPPGATDFVPGLLSLEYLNDLEQFPTDQSVYDYLMEKFPLIGFKSAGCILSFGMKRKVFVVDTHVHRFAKWLGWIPEKFSANNACFHLDGRVPADLKLPLHQAFWHHGRNCLRCMGTSTRKTKGWDNCVCPLEEHLDRSLGLEGQNRENGEKARKRKKGSGNNSTGSSKKPKHQPTRILYEKMSPDDARIANFVLDDIDELFNDDFGTGDGNKIASSASKQRYWVKAVAGVDDTPDEAATIDNVNITEMDADADADAKGTTEVLIVGDGGDAEDAGDGGGAEDVGDAGDAGDAGGPGAV